jgi:molybdopterin converting factor subunit 1
MRVTVRLFARLRDLAESDAVIVESESPTVAAVRRALTVNLPKASQLIARSAVAVNGEYAAEDQPVTAADEVALIPPVSGG